MATNELPKHIIRKFSRIVKNTTFVANQTAPGIKTILLVKLEILIKKGHFRGDLIYMKF